MVKCFCACDVRRMWHDLKKIHTGSHSARVSSPMKRQASSLPWERVCSTLKIAIMPLSSPRAMRSCYYCRKKTFAQCSSYKNVGCTAGFEPSGGGLCGVCASHGLDCAPRSGQGAGGCAV